MDTPESMDAVARIQATLKEQGKKPGFRGPKGERQYVELPAADILEACERVPGEEDEIVNALENGCLAGKPERSVTIMADHAIHLCQAAGR